MLRVHKLPEPRPEALPELRALYERCFDVAERVPFETLCARVTERHPYSAKNHLWEARNGDGPVIGPKQ